MSNAFPPYSGDSVFTYSSIAYWSGTARVDKLDFAFGVIVTHNCIEGRAIDLAVVQLIDVLLLLRFVGGLLISFKFRRFVTGAVKFRQMMHRVDRRVNLAEYAAHRCRRCDFLDEQSRQIFVLAIAFVRTTAIELS